MNLLCVNEDFDVVDGEGILNLVNWFYMWIYCECLDVNCIIYMYLVYVVVLLMFE